jgi:serine/threonine protein kinase
MTVVLRGDREAPSVDRARQLVGERYRLVAELGRGSTGAVWDAHDITTNERVAVKILHEDLRPSPSARKRFHREIASATALEHPHSVRVMADGVAPDGADYLVMEHLEGRTLAVLLEENGPLPQARAIRIVAQILEATGEAHRLGIVHRDLKPGNVMLVASQEQADFVKVCDYGLAKLFEARELEDGDGAGGASFSTVQGVLCGTPAYMSPEQARGDELDGRTDLYAISVMLFQMVVGRMPFDARGPIAMISCHLGTPPPRPRTLRPDLDIAPALEALVLRGMSKDRRERPCSAEVFRADLLQIQRDLVRDERVRTRASESSRSGETLPSFAPPPRPLPRRAHMERRRLAGGLVVALGALGLVFARTSSRNQRVGTPAVAAVASARVPARPSTVHVPRPPALAPPSASPPAPQPASTGTTLRRRSSGKMREIPTEIASPEIAEPETTVIEPVPAAPARAPQTGAAELLRDAEAALRGGNLEAARALGMAAAERQPSLASAWELLGRCTMRLGRAEEARSFYKRALALAPDGPNAPFIRAIVGTP